MDPAPIDPQYAIYLLIAVGWTTLFSMTIRQPVRGLRNLGILACYILAVIMPIRLPFGSALATWCVFGIAAGLLYNAYQGIAYLRDKSPEKTPGLSFAHFVYGLLAWPVMIPEAIEYLLADLGVLRVPEEECDADHPE